MQDVPDTNGCQPAPKAPTWLRLVVLLATLWLAVKIVENVTDALIGMAGRHMPASHMSLPRGE